MLRKHLGSSLGVKECPNGHSGCRVCKLSGPSWDAFTDRLDPLTNTEVRKLSSTVCQDALANTQLPRSQHCLNALRTGAI
jgi:hypothetical protein